MVSFRVRAMVSNRVRAKFSARCVSPAVDHKDSLSC